MSDETPPSAATPPAEATPRPDDSEVGSYLDVQAEVDKHFAGDWEKFLKAVRNPAEILHFVLWRQCDGKADNLRSWAAEKKLPADWVPRFFGMLDPKGYFREGVVTSAPDASQLPPDPIVTVREMLPKDEAEAAKYEAAAAKADEQES